MARTDPQINVRLPAQVLGQIEAAALENHRTLTSEILFRLEQSLKPVDISELLMQAMRKSYEENIAGRSRQEVLSAARIDDEVDLIPARARNAMGREGYLTLWEVDQASDAKLLCIPEFGRKSVRCVRDAIEVVMRSR